jgi:predicted DNA-binding transcriptional regulator AlpA
MNIRNIELIRAKQLAKLLGISITTIWRMRRNEQIPQPMRLGSRMIAWDRAVIEQWIEQDCLL